MSNVNLIQYSADAIEKDGFSRREILRYMGCKESTPDVESLIDKGILECQGKLSYKTVYAEYPISINQNRIDLGFSEVDSRDLARALEGCDSMILFAATVGLGIDRLILKYSHVSPSLAVTLQAIGAERIEKLCNEFSLEMKRKFSLQGRDVTPRFSPGYGDLSLEVQREIFTALSCEKNIGLTLNNSLLMSPTKSVTAMIGIKKH